MTNKKKPLPARPAANPADAPLGSLASRAAARALIESTVKRIQVIVSLRPGIDDVDVPAVDLARCTCHRSRTAAALIETIMLNGKLEDISERDLLRWIETHPIERHTGETRCA